MTTKMASKRRIRKVPQKWIRNESDSRAAARGYTFDERRGIFVCEWIEENCILYEGECAGQPMRLDGWQQDATMRMFGWVHHSEKYKRDIRRFTRVFIWISKKNKKTPTLAAWGLYLFCGDGEKGQKVFSGAKDGKQAAIAHTHATKMIEQFPGFGSRFTINGTTRRITDHENAGIYEILTVDTSKGEAKEGINGSVMIDETHVVDRSFAEVIKRAGISRSEPMQIAASTAGNDPDCWGKEQWEFGRRVESGEFDADHFLHIEHAAPQDTADDQLRDRKELIRLGKMANPAWGQTIDEKEFLSDYDDSSKSLSSLSSFKRYRLGIWQQGANPWLSLGAWKRCERVFTADDLEGRSCSAGLDLASVRDLNALALCFDEPDGRFAFLWWFFLPEETARNLADKVAFEQMARDPRCNLILTPGSAVQHERVTKLFRELSQRFTIEDLFFDKWGAEETTRTMAEGKAIDGAVIEEGTGVPRTEFPQAITAFSEPTKKFEELLLSEKLFHNGDPCMAWQASHVAVRRDENDNIKPVKPGGKDDYRKIDGFIAGIMALKARTMRLTGTMSIYDDPQAGEVLL